MLRALFAIIVVVFGAAAAATYFAMFIVHQNEQAIVLEFGKPVTIINEPGLYWKVPVVQTVEYFDKRILDLDTAPQEVTASDQKRIVVDACCSINRCATSAKCAPDWDPSSNRPCAGCSAARPSRMSCATGARR
jgi:uncharacterized membrane protein YqiK